MTISAGKQDGQWETFHFTQKGTTTGSLTANGGLTDTTGHKGTWTQNASANGSVDDWVTITLNDGKETNRIFHIKESSSSQGRFEETDNGLNLQASTATNTYEGSHSLLISSASSSGIAPRKTAAPPFSLIAAVTIAPLLS